MKPPTAEAMQTASAPAALQHAASRDQVDAETTAGVADASRETASVAHRRVLPTNFAVQNRRRLESLVAAGDVNAVDTLYRSDVEVVDEIRGSRYGYAARRELLRIVTEQSESLAVRHEPLATLGGSLLVCRLCNTLGRLDRGRCTDRRDGIPVPAGG